MPNTKSAIRRVRRVKKQSLVNKIRKSKYKSAIKKMEAYVKNGEKDKAKKFYSEFQSVLMQVAKSGIINKKRASRKISKIKQYNFKYFQKKNNINKLDLKKKLILEIGIGMGENLIHLSKKNTQTNILKKFMIILRVLVTIKLLQTCTRCIPF